jgi:hypothetical protein
MPDKLDSATRLSKLRQLGILDRFPDLAALEAIETSADRAIAEAEAERAADREAARRLTTPIEFTLPTVPEAHDDIAIVQYGSCPKMWGATVDGQAYAPKLARGPISFLPRKFADALDHRQAQLGWFSTTVARVAALDEILGPQDFRTVVGACGPDQIPVLIVAYRRLLGRQGAQAKDLLRAVDGKLSELSHSTSGPIQGTARAEHDAEEADADRIIALGGPVAAPVPAEEDPIAKQISETNAQTSKFLTQQIIKADRDAARAVIIEAEEDARFAEKVKAASA